MVPALWNMQAKAKSGRVSEVEMLLLVTVSITAFSWERDGFGSQGLFYKFFNCFDIPC